MDYNNWMNKKVQLPNHQPTHKDVYKFLRMLTVNNKKEQLKKSEHLNNKVYKQKQILQKKHQQQNIYEQMNLLKQLQQNNNQKNLLQTTAMYKPTMINKEPITTYNNVDNSYYVDRDAVLDPIKLNEQVKNFRKLEPSIHPFNVLRTKKILYNVDSSLRADMTNDTTTNFRFHFPETLKNVISIKLSTIELPNSINNINSTNNKMWMSENVGYTSNTVEVEILEGIYTTTSLLNKLNEIFDAITNGVDVWTPKIVASYDDATSKFKLSRASSTTPGKQFWFKSSNPSAGSIEISIFIQDILNFDSSSQVSSLDGDNAHVSLTEADNKADLSSHSYFFLCIDGFKNIENPNGLKTYPYDAFAKVIMDSNSNAWVFNNNNLMAKKLRFTNPRDLANLDMSIRDKNGDLADLGGNYFSCTLEFEQIIDRRVLKNKR